MSQECRWGNTLTSRCPATFGWKRAIKGSSGRSIEDGRLEDRLIPHGLEWNEAELEPRSPLNRGLLAVVAFDSPKVVYLVGTAFIIGAFGHRAVGCTAAHNFAEVRKFQTPPRLHHPTSLREFLPQGVEIDLDRTRIRALYAEGSQLEMAILDWVIWDEKADVAFFSLRTQEDENRSFFDSDFMLESHAPGIGDEVAVIGYQGMEAETDELTNGAQRLTIRRRLVLRCGRVSAFYPDGHALCRGPCIETTIPVFPGMSGGPAMRLGQGGMPMQPFGLVSSDPDEPSDKSDRSLTGHSIIPLIRSVVEVRAGVGQRKTLLRLDSAISVGLGNPSPTTDQ